MRPIQMNAQANPSGLLAAVFNQLEHVVDVQVVVGSGNEGPLDPVINRWRVPGYRCDLVLHRRVVDVGSRKGGFNLERIKRAGFGGDAFLSDNPGNPRSSPDSAARAVDVVGPHGPGLADGERELNSAAIVRRVSPGTRLDDVPRTIINRETILVVAGANLPGSYADLARRNLRNSVLPGRGDLSCYLVVGLVGPVIAGMRLFHRDDGLWSFRRRRRRLLRRRACSDKAHCQNGGVTKHRYSP